MGFNPYTDNAKKQTIKNQANIQAAFASNDYLTSKLSSFTSFYRDFYIESGTYSMKGNLIATSHNSWWILNQSKEFTFKVHSNTSWVVIGIGSDPSAYVVLVNLKGFTTRNVVKALGDSSGTVNNIDTTITAAAAVAGDYVKVTILGNRIKFFKKNGTVYEFWFEVDTTTMTDIVTRCLGLYHSPSTTGLVSCEDFDGQLTNAKPSLIEVSMSQKVESIWNSKNALSLGDSIVAQDGVVYGGTSTIAKGYQTILKEKLGFSSILNKGISGAPMANGTANGAGTNTTGKNQTYTSQDLVIIAAGTNDFKLNVALGTQGIIGDTTFDTNTFYGAYRDLIEFILKAKPTIRIVLFTPLQRDNSGYDVNFSNTSGHKLIDYVNAIKNIGQMYSVPVVDLYNNSGITKLNLATYTIDGLHPNDAGYSRAGGYASKIIEQINP